MGLSMPRSRCPLADRFGFGSYFQLTPGGDFSALLLTYGFPLFLIGCALKVSNQFVGLSSCRAVVCSISYGLCGRYLWIFRCRKDSWFLLLKIV